MLLLYICCVFFFFFFFVWMFCIRVCLLLSVLSSEQQVAQPYSLEKSCLTYIIDSQDNI